MSNEKWIVWIDPASAEITDPIYHKCPVSTAVALQREQGRKNDYLYASDEEALWDFMTTHWAWYGEPE